MITTLAAARPRCVYMLATVAALWGTQSLTASPVRINGSLSGFVQHGLILSLGINSPGSLRGHLFGHGPDHAPNSSSNASFTLDTTSQDILLAVEADQFASPPIVSDFQSMSVHLSMNLRIKSFTATHYSFSGIYNFMSELPGTNLSATLILEDVTTGVRLLEWSRVVGSDVPSAVIELGEQGPNEGTTGGLTGILLQDHDYTLSWDLSFANPVGSTASGEITSPFRFHFIEIIPEPGWAPACIAFLGGCVLSTHKRRSAGRGLV